MQDFDESYNKVFEKMVGLVDWAIAEKVKSGVVFMVLSEFAQMYHHELKSQGLKESAISGLQASAVKSGNIRFAALQRHLQQQQKASPA